MMKSAYPLAPAAGMLQYLFSMRLYALFAQALVIAAAQWVLHIRLPLAALLWVLAVSALLSALSAWRQTAPWPVTALECFVHLLADMAVLTALLYFAGGASNPFISLYLLPVVIAATALPAVFAWSMSAFSIAAYSLLSVWYEPLVLPSGAAAFPLHLLGMRLNFILSAVLITAIVGGMARSIRARDQSLARLRERRLRDEQIVALGSLAAGAAHELSTPLATMSVLAGEILAADSGTLKDDLALLQQQIGVCKDILTRLTRREDFARSDSGGVQAVDVWLPTLLDTWQLMRPLAQCAVRWLGAMPAPRIIAGDALGQAVLNLCNNAADAGDNRLEIEVDWNAREVEIHILDHGAGFNPALPLGTAFFTTKREQGGSGIGLLIANASIEHFGGTVSMQARNGGGTRVRVQLPVFTGEAT